MSLLPHKPLRMLFWESTARCNLACAHCRRLDTRPGDDELTAEEARAVFRSAAKLGRPVIVFSGGEPLLRDDWESLAHYARTLHLPTALATNGTEIDAAMARRITAAGFGRVAISLDGAEAQTHDALRGPGGFNRALSGAEHVRSAAVPLQFNATVTRDNVDQLDALADLARRAGAVAMHLFMLVPVGCGEQLAASKQLPPDRYAQVLHWVYDRQQEGALEVRATCGPQFYRVAARRSGQAPAGRGCLAGVSVVFVSHRGEVFPCGYLPVRCGSVRQTPLETIWEQSEVLRTLRDPDRLEGNCGRCEHRYICGGCRARAYAATGNYLGGSPCLDEPAK